MQRGSEDDMKSGLQIVPLGRAASLIKSHRSLSGVHGEERVDIRGFVALLKGQKWPYCGVIYATIVRNHPIPGLVSSFA